MITYYRVPDGERTAGVLCRIKDEARESADWFGPGNLRWGRLEDPDSFLRGLGAPEEISPSEAGDLTRELLRAAAAQQ